MVAKALNTTPYCPRRGDVISLDFDPQAGCEQARRRPALVVSPYDYNTRVGLALVFPITTQVKAYPFEVPLPEGLEVKGVILADRGKSLDWGKRQARFICTAPPEVIDDVRAKFQTLLD